MRSFQHEIFRKKIAHQICGNVDFITVFIQIKAPRKNVARSKIWSRFTFRQEVTDSENKVAKELTTCLSNGKKTIITHLSHFDLKSWTIEKLVTKKQKQKACN